MGAFTSEERLALLLNVLGDDMAKVAFQAMNPVRATYIQKASARFPIGSSFSGRSRIRYR